MLGSHQRRRAPRTTGLSFGSRLRSNRTSPTDASCDIEADHVGSQQKELLWGGMRSLTDRA